jgi:hypothetical protein
MLSFGKGAALVGPEKELVTRGLIKASPGQSPISEPFVDPVHRFEEVILLFFLLKKIHLKPFFL